MTQTQQKSAHNKSPVLQVERLNVQIQDRPILRDVSLSVGAGEIVALTGESGSGKSMTALAIMGLLPIGATATGEINLNGQDLITSEEAELCRLRGNDVAMIFQEPMTALNPVQTIGAQVAEPLRLHRQMSRRDAKQEAARLLTRVGLPPDRFPLKLYPHQLSGGQRQRVMIAMAIALKPKLLIADEPTTALDVVVQAQILDLLQHLAIEDQMGVILITHDLAVVADYAHQINVMRYGEIVEHGATAHMLSQMSHPYSKALFAAARHCPDLPPHGDWATGSAAPASTPLLKVDNVTRTYPTPRQGLRAMPPKVAVDEVSFTIHPHERIGLVGESGCGKSTLTRAILGLDPVQGGQISRTNGARVQAVFQDPYGSFNPRHKVEHILREPFFALPAPPSHTSIDGRINQALQDVGLDPATRQRFIHEFSGGQRQRIAIARALISRPELIIFDEAVSALDVSVRAQVLDLIAGLCRSYGLTYLFISHDLSVVRAVTDRILVMRHGKIVEEIASDQIFTAPQHPYTQKLIQTVPRLDQP